MVRSIALHTWEIDDKEAAVAEVLGQLEAAGGLSKNSVGVIACHYEFVLAGVAEAICAALPFEVIGTISATQGVTGARDTMLLTILALTGDDVEFGVALSEPLTADVDARVSDVYRRAAAGRGKPKLALTFAAFMPQNVGDEYVDIISRESGGAPCFGTLAIDDTPTYEYSFMVHDGAEFRDRMGLILVYGAVKPEFFSVSVGDGKLYLDKPALITKADRHILTEVNGRPFMDFLEGFGLAKGSEESYGLSTIPFMVDYGDGSPMGSKVFITLTPDKQGIFGGAMPVGATLYMGSFDKTDVLTTTRELATGIKAAAGGRGAALMYSCVSRYMTLGGDSYAEFDALAEGLGGAVPMLMAYSGGEICPSHEGGEKMVNRFNNNALIACVF